MTAIGPVAPPLPPTPSATPPGNAGGTTPAVPGATPVPSAPTTTASAVPAVTAILVNLPNTLRRSGASAPVIGTLVESEAPGKMVIQTQDGIVLLRGASANVAIGSRLLLYLPPVADEGSTVRLAVMQGRSDAAPTRPSGTSGAPFAVGMT